MLKELFEQNKKVVILVALGLLLTAVAFCQDTYRTARVSIGSPQAGTIWTDGDTIHIEPGGHARFIKIGSDVYEIKTTHSIEKVVKQDSVYFMDRPIPVGEKVLTLSSDGALKWCDTEEINIAEEVRKNGASNNPKTAQIK